jgi:hypothetical protein
MLESIATNIDTEQDTKEIVLCSKKSPVPTANDDDKTLKIIIGISNTLLMLL